MTKIKIKKKRSFPITGNVALLRSLSKSTLDGSAYGIRDDEIIKVFNEHGYSCIRTSRGWMFMNRYH